MRKVVLLSIFGLFAVDVFAVRHAAFETDFYNQVVSVTNRATVAFSPLSAEVDLAVTAESLDTISRANVAEAMGVLVEFGGVYRPILNRLASGTNGFSCVMARGFCLTDLRKVRPDYRVRARQDYGAEIMPILPVEGAQSWFRAAMDGWMEDFSVGSAVAISDRYSFFDLTAVRAEWVEPFPTSGIRRLSFSVSEKVKVGLDFVTDVRVAETWEDREYDVLKLPLRGGYSFYALLPKPGVELARVREDFSSMEIESLLAMTRAGLPSAGHYRKEPTVLVIPRLDLDSQNDFTEAVQYFRVPTSALAGLAPDTPVGRFVQRVRFTLLECGPTEPPLGEKPPERLLKVVPGIRRVFLTRPFLYFVLDNETSVIPVAGQFTGIFENVAESKGGSAK